MPSFKVTLVAVAVALSSVSGSLQIEKRQSGVPYQAYVDAARERIHAGQVTFNNAALLAAQIAADVAQAASVAAALVVTQAEDLSAIMSFEDVLGGSPSSYADVNAKFAAKQAAIAVASAAKQAAIAVTNESAVRSTGAAAQSAADSAARVFAAILANDQLVSPPLSCGGNVCNKALNGAVALCDANQNCNYSCNDGVSRIMNSGPGIVSCLNVMSDSNNCGGQNVVCLAPYNGIGYTSCVMGNCAVQCPTGYSTKFFATGAQFCGK